MSCPQQISLPWHGTIRGTNWRQVNTIMAALPGVSEGVVINIGAKWNPFDHRDFAFNDDPAWSLTFAVDTLHAIGFEAREDAYNATLLALRNQRAAWWAVDRGATARLKRPEHEDPPEWQARLFGRVKLFHERVDPSTICLRLATALSSATTRRLPVLLLKVDIDSFDLPLVDAILHCPNSAASRPRAFYVEVNSFVPLAIRFKALPPLPFNNSSRSDSPGDGSRRPTYGGGAMSGKSNKWPCYGASLSAWEEMATRAGYRLLATSHQLTNAIFVDSTLRNVHALSSSSVWCHAGPVDTSGMLERLNSRPRQRFTLDSPSARQMENASAVNLALALRTMKDRCASTSTPYQAIIHL